MCNYLFILNENFIFQICDVMLNNTKLFLASNYDMKDMGEARVILGVKITRMTLTLNCVEKFFDIKQ